MTYVTVVRNGAATIARAIESVQAQTYPHVEHVILDGASVDGTLSVVRRYADRLDYFASQADRGVYDALNKAIPLARGDFICVLNADDWLEPTAAETAVRRLARPGTEALLFTGANVRSNELGQGISGVEREWAPALVHPGCHFTCALDCHNGIYATRPAYQRSGSYDARYGIAADFKWIMTCFELGIDFTYTKEISVNYTLGGISSDNGKHARECIRIAQERFSYLTEAELLGLYHSFFLLPAPSDLPGRPLDTGAFLRQLLVDHSHDRELAAAVAWATLAQYDDHEHRRSRERTKATKSDSASGLERLAKRVLRDHPRVYGAAGRVASALRRT